ncbi:hypothetical protein GCM10007140_26690 [Priestia taiwanensis]|uniref:Uncharacterized protein n=1 Tax=Priestia taiwanensis TaxID=1347902 RepID=A0A917AWD0_9BACI|nr:hypothetical protein GCM10007140_26690 [Priestia taiwanensis]
MFHTQNGEWRLMREKRGKGDPADRLAEEARSRPQKASIRSAVYVVPHLLVINHENVKRVGIICTKY